MSTSSKTRIADTTSNNVPFVDMTDDVLIIDDDPDKTVVAMVAEVQSAEGVVAEVITDSPTAPYKTPVPEIFPEGGTTSGERFDIEVKSADLKVRANALSRVLRSFPAILQNFGTSKAWMHARTVYLEALRLNPTRPDIINGALTAWLTFVEDRIVALGDVYEEHGHNAEVFACYDCGHFLPTTVSQFLQFKNGVPIGTSCLKCENNKSVHRVGVKAIQDMRSGKRPNVS